MKIALLAAVAALAIPVAAEARTIAALTDTGALAIVDSETRRAARTVAITGVDAPIAGIDVRPADGKLYALTYSGAVFTIDTETGAATRKSQLRLPPPVGSAVIVDFNPVANRLRIMGAGGVSLRANVDDGKVTEDTKLHMADSTDAVTVIAGAYTNSKAGVTETTLFDIDATGRLLRQAPPNDGVLNAVGALGATPAAIAFDIALDGEANVGWAVAGGALHKIDLTTGAATSQGQLRGVRGAVRDIAVLPE